MGQNVPTSRDCRTSPRSVHSVPRHRGVHGTATATLWHKRPTSILGSDMTELTEAYGVPRAAPMLDRDGDKIGKIDDIYEDKQTGRPEWALVNTGLLRHQEDVRAAARRAARPARTSASRSRRRTSRTRPSIEADGELSEQRGARALQRTTASATTTPTSMPAGRRTAATPPGPRTDDAMTRSEEELRVGTERREAGRARLRKYVGDRDRAAHGARPPRGGPRRARADHRGQRRPGRSTARRSPRRSTRSCCTRSARWSRRRSSPRSASGSTPRSAPTRRRSRRTLRKERVETEGDDRA